MKAFSLRVLLALGFIAVVGSFHGVESAAREGTDSIPAWAIGVEDYAMFEGLSPFTILGLTPQVGLSNKDITTRFRLLARLIHPDRNAGRRDDAGRAFQLLNNAYDAIRNPGVGRNPSLPILGLMFDIDGGRRNAIVEARLLRERNFKDEEFAANGTLSPEDLDNLWQLYQTDLKDIGTVEAQAARLRRRSIDPAVAQAAADAAAAAAAAQRQAEAAARAQQKAQAAAEQQQAEAAARAEAARRADVARRTAVTPNALPAAATQKKLTAREILRMKRAAQASAPAARSAAPVSTPVVAPTPKPTAPAAAAPRKMTAGEIFRMKQAQQGR